MWAGWLGRTGQLDPLTHPWDRVTRERVKAFITEYSVVRAELTVAGAVRGIAYVLRACAAPDGVPGLTGSRTGVRIQPRPCPKLPSKAWILRAGEHQFPPMSGLKTEREEHGVWARIATGGVW